jgi:catechol 2,3-dioxygenase-like lactoylglutathione lyase family enzyme
MKHAGLDHIHFFATDLEKAISFYSDMGLELVKRHEHGGRRAAQMKTQFGLIIDINETRAADNPGYSHIALALTDLRDAERELKSKGYTFDGPTTNKDTGRTILTVRDPNGFLFQLVQE